jgi:glucokinase
MRPDRHDDSPHQASATDCVIGVDLGGTKLLAGAVARDLGVLARVRRPAPATDTSTLLDAVAAAVTDVAAAAAGGGGGAGAGARVRAVGYGIPCLVDETGIAVSSTHLPLEGVDFAAELERRTGLQACVENDANAALVAEHRHGAARGAANALMLTLGTGIGGGIVIDDRLYRGSRGAAGELGHMVVWADGPDCGPGCPSRGCLEAMASGTALVRAGRRAAAERPDGGLGRALGQGREIDGPLVTELAMAGDASATAVLREIGQWLGIGLVNLTNIFNPDVIVVGGGVIAAGDLLLRPAREVLAARALRLPGGRVRIAAAHFGAESGMLGGALLAYDLIDRRAA